MPQNQLTTRQKRVPLFKWKPTDNDKLATYDGGIFIMKFEKVFYDDQGDSKVR